jgi:hypothetical protein
MWSNNRDMKKFYFILIALFLVNGAMAQTKQPCSTCLPEGITFSTQAQIDNFQINYPNCTQIEGDVIITDGYTGNITNFYGLSVLTSVVGSLTIGGNSSLTSLAGLDNLDSIGGALRLGSHGEMSWGNPSLTTLMGLNSLTSIGGELQIESNYALTSLTGLDNLDADSFYPLSICYNNSLSTCAVQCICDYLAGHSAFIHDNATGCNSVEEVDTACVHLLSGDAHNLTTFSLYPNPASTTITIETTAKGSLSIHNTSGQQLLQQDITGPATTIDVGNLPGGVYFVRLSWEKNVSVGKFIKQ